MTDVLFSAVGLRGAPGEHSRRVGDGPGVPRLLPHVLARVRQDPPGGEAAPVRAAPGRDSALARRAHRSA